MKVSIRAHVKNQNRLNLLRGTIESCKKAGFTKIQVIDDQSPFGEIGALCESLKVDYFRTNGEPSTKNGLYWSFLKGADLHIVDDCVLSPRIVSEVENAKLLLRDNNTWMISFFACYPKHVREANRQSDYWRYPVETFYAGIACCYHQDLIDEYMAEFKKDPYAAYQDDLTIKHLIMENKKKIYNTTEDYAQHTGVGERAFGPNPKEESSNYVSEHFVGE